MEDYNQTGNLQSSKAVEAALDQLEYLLETAQGYAANMEQKARALEYFETQPSLKTTEENRKEGHLPRLFKLVEILTDVNERNKQTLVHLDGLL